jgi:hypothetical protein
MKVVLLLSVTCSVFCIWVNAARCCAVIGVPCECQMPIEGMEGIGTNGGSSVIQFFVDNLVFKIFVTLFVYTIRWRHSWNACGQLAGVGVSLEMCIFWLLFIIILIFPLLIFDFDFSIVYNGTFFKIKSIIINITVTTTINVTTLPFDVLLQQMPSPMVLVQWTFGLS